MVGIFEELFTGTFSGILVMGLISAAVIFFLRFLYGPRGVFRDPRWDESNKRIRRQESEDRERRLKSWQKREQQHDE